MEVERVTLQMLFDGCLENKEQNSFVVLEWKMLFFGDGASKADGICLCCDHIR